MKKFWYIFPIMIIGLFLIVSQFFFTTPRDKDIDAKLAICDEKQAHMNMAIFPDCSANIFKESGWKRNDAIRYMKKNRNIDVNKFINEENTIWKNAWGEDVW